MKLQFQWEVIEVLAEIIKNMFETSNFSTALQINNQLMGEGILTKGGN